ncbi:hypothetical protein M0R72_14925 [Candidatus Pacearchaeota archaeon]|jgi:hypothetical protein|nr:hypothetical protein [Candidatus Pacearchaeota archaeon]
MSPPLAEDLVRKILDDLQSDRYKAGNISLEEIAAIRLGDRKKGGTISKLAKKHKIPLRKQGLNKRGVSFQSPHSNKEPKSSEPLKVECFTAEARLSLIDEAITIHKSLLPGVKDPYKMEKWSSALDRLLEQRRIEEPPQSGSEQEMLDKIVGALDQHAAAVSPKAGPSVSGLPEDPANPDVRIG